MEDGSHDMSLCSKRICTLTVARCGENVVEPTKVDDASPLILTGRKRVSICPAVTIQMSLPSLELSFSLIYLDTDELLSFKIIRRWSYPNLYHLSLEGFLISKEHMLRLFETHS